MLHINMSEFYLNVLSILQFNDTLNPNLNYTTWINPFIEFFFLMGLIITMIYMYRKMRIWVLILFIFLFSIIFGMISIMNFSVPFSPYIQIFFILFQTIVFFITSMEVFKK